MSDFKEGGVVPNDNNDYSWMFQRPPTVLTPEHEKQLKIILESRE